MHKRPQVDLSYRRILTLLLLLQLAACGIDLRSLKNFSGSPPSNERTVNQVYLTFYGFDDNDDGNGHFGNAVIADPVIHPIATEDIGSYQHPSTFATDYAVARPGQIIYVPKLRKYYIMEDTCVACAADEKKGKTHLDLYLGGNTALQGPSLAACEDLLTASPFTDTVIFDPSNDHPVSTTPLLSAGVCQSNVWSSLLD